MNLLAKKLFVLASFFLFIFLVSNSASEISKSSSVAAVASASPSSSISSSPSPSYSASPSVSASPTYSASPSASVTSTPSPTPSYSSSPSATVSASPTPTATVTSTPTPTYTPTYSPTPSYTTSPTSTYVPTATIAPTVSPSASASVTIAPKPPVKAKTITNTKRPASTGQTTSYPTKNTSLKGATAKSTGNTCYVSTPAPGPYTWTIANGAQKKTLSLPITSPGTLLQDYYFASPLADGGCIYLEYGEPISQFFILSTGKLMRAVGWRLTNYESDNVTVQAEFWVNGLADISASSAQDRIAKEDTLLSSVDASRELRFRLSDSEGGQWIENAVSATNCLNLGERRSRNIVFMRGDGWNGSVNDLLWVAQNAREQILATDPFKTAKDSLSFSVDLHKKNQQVALSATDASVVKSQSSCGVNNYAYVYLYAANGTSKGSYSLPKTGVSFVEQADFSHPTRGGIFIVRELGRGLAGLYSEVSVGNALGRSLQETNCAYDPFKTFRDPATNRMYGSIEKTPCHYNTYYRANDVSLMGNQFGTNASNPSANKFDVPSCAHILASLSVPPASTKVGDAFWKTCEEKMDTAKEGIPPIAKKVDVGPIWDWNPKGPSLGILEKGQEIRVFGSGFTEIGNSVQISLEAGNVPGYEFANLKKEVDGDDQYVSFIIPTNLGSGQYNLIAGALNGPWSDRKSFRLLGSAPSDLVAKADKKGQIDLTWKDNSDDEVEFEVRYQTRGAFGLMEVFDPGVVKANDTHFVIKDLLPSIEHTLTVSGMVRRTGGGGYVRVTSEPVKVTTLPKPAAPVLTARAISDEEIEYSWSGDTDIDKYVLTVILDAEKFETFIPQLNTSAEVKVGLPIANTLARLPGNTTRYRLDNLRSKAEECIVVRAYVNDDNYSDLSNTACATTMGEFEPTENADIADEEFINESGLTLDRGSLDNLSGTASFTYKSNLKNISSVDLVSEDGRVLSTSKSAPWKLEFNSAFLENGKHFVYTVIYVKPGPGQPSEPVKSKPLPITVNTPGRPTASLECQVSGSSIALKYTYSNTYNPTIFEGTRLVKRLAQGQTSGTFTEERLTPGATSVYHFRNGSQEPNPILATASCTIPQLTLSTPILAGKVTSVNSLTLTWIDPNPSRFVEKYLITEKTVGALGFSTFITGQNAVVLAGLKPNTKYCYALRAIAQIGKAIDSAEGEQVCLTTPLPKPSLSFVTPTTILKDTVQMKVTTSVSSILGMDLYVDNVKTMTKSTAPWTLPFNTKLTKNGNHTIHAIVRTSWGDYKTNVMTVKVGN